MRRGRIVVASVAGALALAVPTGAHASLEDEQALAERHAPVVRLVEQLEECGPGEPYDPLDVDVLLGEATVALRGPWSSTDLVEIGPTAEDLVDRYEYHLDFPGSALDPGCGYELWSRRISAGSEPAVYAHVATDPGRPGRLALQYWLFYAFNDFNNTHEGDWEMVQLVFEADDAAAALEREPVEIGFSSHEGAERADWDDEDKLERVDDTHPVLYPAAGSHANKFTDALYLGSSAEAGVGCDDTRGPHRELRPAVHVIPSEPGAARQAFPWISFAGRWGELQKAFFNGPTGPNLKDQWTEPIRWAEGWRDTSYAVPTGGLFGTRATDLFCGGIAAGSSALAALLRNPLPLVLFLGAVVALAAFVIIRATWHPVAPLRVARRRTWGQILSSSAWMYGRRLGLFLGIGLLLIPIAVAITLLQWLVHLGVEIVDSLTGEAAGTWAFLSLVIGTTLALLGLGLVQAATACALVELDAGRPVGPVAAYRLALRRLRPLLRAIAVFVVAWVVLTATAVLIPVAIWLAVRWSLLAPAVVLEERSALAALGCSRELVRRRWLRVGSLVGVSAALALAIGPLAGVLLIVATNAPLAAINVVSGIVYALTMPFVALVTAYVYFDARTRHELEPAERPDQLPAEITLAG